MNDTLKENQVISRVMGGFSFNTDGDFNMGSIEKLKDYCTRYNMHLIDDDPYHIDIMFNWDISDEISSLYTEDLFFKLRDVFQRIGCEVNSHKLYVMKYIIDMFSEAVDNYIFKRKTSCSLQLSGNYEGTQISYDVIYVNDKKDVKKFKCQKNAEAYFTIYNLIGGVTVRELGVTLNDILYFTHEKKGIDIDIIHETLEKMIKQEIVTTMFRDDGTLVYMFGRLSNL